DVCPESTTRKEHLEKAISITTQWAERCQRSHNDTGQHLFGIIQGGVYPELRKLSAQQITDIDFPGYAIGGLSLGEAKPVMWNMVEHTIQFLPVNKPRYLMGVGSPEDIFEGIARGIDIFDCALPTRVARNGALFTYGGRKNIKRATYKDVMEPVEVTCGCYTCRNFSAAYLHHLFKCEELLAYRLATVHNLFFMNNLLDEIRASLRENRFLELKNNFINKYQTTDEDKRLEQKLRSKQGKRETASPDF
ncbi:MAG: tRNA guanosine(34) transglycosylase Tgt, partial [Chloroflexi bacterium]|nr:tRNA guanosine(34) transglycosylase Tgt [Chloroflexota bacterium]